MRTSLKITPQEIIDAYNLTALVNNQGCIYMRIEKGMYGLKQAGTITNQELVNHMDLFGNHYVQHTPGLWVHDSRFFEVLWSTIYVLNISQQRMPKFFKSPQSQIPHHI